MKKAGLVIAVLVVVLAAGLWVYWPQVRVWQLRQALDRVILPGLKAQIAATSGQEPTLTYQSLGVEGSAYLVENPTLSLAGEPRLILSAQRLMLNNVDLSLWGDLNSCDLALHQVVLESQGLKLTVRNWEVNRLAVERGGRQVAVARELLQGLAIQGPGLPGPLELASVEGRGYRLALDLDQRRYQGELGSLTALGHDFSLGLEGMTFRGDFVRVVQGRACYDRAEFAATGFRIAKAGDPPLTIARLAGISRRGESLDGDRVEIKGVSLAPTEPAHAGLAQFLAQYGYQAIDLDLTLDYAYDRKAKTFELKELSLSGKDAGRLEASLAVTNLDYDPAQDLGRNLPALKAARLKGLKLRYDDASLTDRVLIHLAREEGLDLEAKRRQLLDQAPALRDLARDPAGAAGAEPLPPKAAAQDQRARQAVRDFLAKPGSLCLAISPTRELSLEELAHRGSELWPGNLEISLDNCGQ
ncbi:MAG: hypothetical protein LDL11_07145 [Desulfarculus sp.]|nr:hypothetical protein [Desulfarculus sp.]